MSTIDDAAGLEALTRLAEASRPAMVLTGAGLSTASGIPDYRGEDGAWKRAPPIMYQDFVRSHAVRRRYWARSLLGFEHFRRAQPNEAHHALARLESAGWVHHLVTQNVDGLHRRAGSHRVTDLHGTLDGVACLACAQRVDRDEFQDRLRSLNPGWRPATVSEAPDGDADLEGADYEQFRIPDCLRCAGILKPTVVFFGESVPRERVAFVRERLAGSRALLVAGSSLMVFSGYRFVRDATRRGLPVAVINRGRTRADGEIGLKLTAAVGPVLSALAERLGAAP